MINPWCMKFTSNKHFLVHSFRLYLTVNLVNKSMHRGVCVFDRVCACVGQSNISTVTEIQETAPSATNVATSIKFPPTKGHHREPITSESLSLACLKPLWRRVPPHTHLAALANMYLHLSDKNLFLLSTNTTATAEHCVLRNTLVGRHLNTSNTLN